MKTKKILVLSLVLCLAFTCLTAFAATDINVTTITSYDHDALGTDTMTVTATISGVAEGDWITYYVSNGKDIVFIDQVTADGGSFDFDFEATKDAVIGATAKNGSNQDYTFPKFTFAAGCNFLTQGDANAVFADPEAPYALASTLGIEGVSANAYAFTCNLSGNATEYGVKLGEYEFQAYGCNGAATDDYATYVVVIDGITEAEAATVTAYAR